MNDRVLVVYGLGVLAVLLQSSTGFRVNLLGPELVLTAAGYLTTRALLEDGMRAHYTALLRQWCVVLLPALGGTLLLVALLSPPIPVRQAGREAIAGLLQAGNWLQLRSPGDWYADRPGEVNPLGALWLIGLLGQFALIWPLIHAALWRLNRRSPEGTALTVVLLAAEACLVAPVRSWLGAGLPELALGTHTRAAEWLIGAAAACWARQPKTPLTSRLFGWVGLIAGGFVADLYPAAWLRYGGPAAAALCVALLLVAAQAQAPARRRVPGRGLIAELGRSAYPLLVLHLPVFWALQVTVPAARPYALLLVGGALAWLLALLLYDWLGGRRLRDRRWATGLGLLVSAALVAAGGIWLPARAASAMHAGPNAPVVLVLGGSFAADLALALQDHGTRRYEVVDGALPGCGLYPMPPPPASLAQITAAAEQPGMTVAYSSACRDWAGRWRRLVARHHPAALLVDLSTDAEARAGGSPCDASYRRDYRRILARAEALWPADRPVLLATVRAGTGAADAASSSCFNVLLDELIARDPRISPLDLDTLLCPSGTCLRRTARGHQLYTDTVHLSGFGRDFVAPALEHALDEELR